MAEDTPRSIPSPRHEGQGRGPRQGDNREAGGFRIRLSDNEMQAARALQEALGLRSTVAVLGFSLRTLAQQLEAGQLDELVAQQRAQGRDRGPAGEGRGERRGPRDEARSGGGGGNRAPRANPFARPSKPVVSAPAAEPAGDDTAAGPEDSQDPNALQEAPEIRSAEAASEEAAPAAPSATSEAGGAVAESAATVPPAGDAEPAPSSEASA